MYNGNVLFRASQVRTATGSRMMSLIRASYRGQNSGSNHGALALGLVALLPLFTLSTSCEKKKHRVENISLYLKPESQQLLAKHLADRGMKQTSTNQVCFSRKSNDDSRYVFKPLYGQRAAFRLKGIIQTESGLAVGIGRLSTMVGEVQEDDFVASMPILDPSSENKPSQEEIDTLLDIPTRLQAVKNIRDGGTFWKGRLPSASVKGTSYPAISGVRYTPLPVNKQIVVEGYICSSRFADSEGNCGYDRSLDKEEQEIAAKIANTPAATTATPVPAPASEEAPAKVVVRTDPSSEHSDANADASECPVCRYMKGGPCKEQFIAWDECVQKASAEDLSTVCFKLTCSMMQCMKLHEYYDIMSAGTDFSKLEDAEKKADFAKQEEVEKLSESDTN